MGKNKRQFFIPPIVIRPACSAIDARTAQWPLTDYGVPQHAWDRGITGDGISVGVSDSGLDEKHVKEGEFSDGRVKHNSDHVGQGEWDKHGHGSWTTSIACGARDDKGMSGVAPGATILHASGLDKDGSGSETTILRSLDALAEAGADIVSCSWGSSRSNRSIERWFDDWADSGKLAVAAAGNGGRDGLDYPGSYDSVISVGAIDRQKRLASFSDVGPDLDLVAPGVDIMGAILNGRHASWSGTSASCPYVSGAFALRFQAEKAEHGRIVTLGANQARSLLERCTTDLGSPGRDNLFGMGAIDFRLLLTDGLSEPAPPGPEPQPGSELEAFWPARGVGVFFEGHVPVIRQRRT